MGVYINMEMPESCAECRFFVDAWCYAFEADDWRNAYNRPPKGERLDNCPLVNVPPHGRLVDADELKTAFPCGESVRTECVRATIEYAPTIIPAEEEGET